MADVEAELSRLKGIITSLNSSMEQVEAANEMRNRLLQEMIDDAFNRIEARTELYTRLVDGLDDIVDAIKANRLSNVAADLTKLLTDIKAAADRGASGASG